MMKKTYNWGIMGAGFIANKVFPGFAHAEGAKVLAVGANTPGKAKQFAGKWNIERIYESYEELVKDPDIDIVYITTVNSLHKENAILAMEHGKHVLCEKPFAMNEKEAQEMVNCAKENKVFLMEAMWTRFLPAVKKVKELIAAGEVGTINNVVSSFCFDSPYDPKHRLYNPNLGGGSLMDVGIYPLSFASFIYGAVPEEYFGYANLKNGVDARDNVILRFENGGMSYFSCALDTEAPSDAVIYGSKGSITIPLFYAASEFEITDYETKKTTKYEYPVDGWGYQFEIEEVMKCIAQGKLESDVMPLEETIEFMRIMDELRKSWDEKSREDCTSR